MADQEITIDRLKPETKPATKVLYSLLAAVVFVILAASWIWIGISPLKIYEKRENAVSYLFGRKITEEDRADAMEMAARMPAIILREDARSEIREKMLKEGKTPDPVELGRDAAVLAGKRLKTMSQEERDTLVTDEYERILDEKKGGFFPPETDTGDVRGYVAALVETIAVAIWGSLFAVAAAVPFSFFAASNSLEIMFQGNTRFYITIRRFLQFGVRRFLDFCRGFNEFVMALIFVAVIGLGPFAGVLALAIHSFGILGKVFSEAVETIEPGQVEGVKASGAGAFQIIVFSVIPQVMPLIVSYSLLRFEANVRSATILGFVGAGGIGFLMFDKLNGYQYREVSTMMIMVIVSVSVIDYLCGKLRKRFI